MEFKRSAACKKLIDIHDPQELMSSNSKGSHYDVSMHMTGFAVVEPVKEPMKQLGVSGVHLASSYKLTSRARQQDKRTRDYAGATTGHAFSIGDYLESRRIEMDSRAAFDERITREIKDSQGEKFGYVYKMMGGCDKQVFPMKKGGLTLDDVRILFDLSKEDDIRKYVKAPKITRRQLPH